MILGENRKGFISWSINPERLLDKRVVYTMFEHFSSGPRPSRLTNYYHYYCNFFVYCTSRLAAYNGARGIIFELIRIEKTNVLILCGRWTFLTEHGVVPDIKKGFKRRICHISLGTDLCRAWEPKGLIFCTDTNGGSPTHHVFIDRGTISYIFD